MSDCPPLSIEYIAGFVDGEGSFGIYPRQTRMMVSNLHIVVLERIRERAGGGVIKGRENDVYNLVIGSNVIREFLPLLVPHLVVKRRIAELILEYLSGIDPRSRATPSLRELRRREQLFNEIKAINDSGGRTAWRTHE